MRESRTGADRINPRSKRRAPVEFGQFAMNDDERVLTEIVQVGARHAELSQRAQHELAVLFEDRSKVERSCGLRVPGGGFC